MLATDLTSLSAVELKALSRQANVGLRTVERYLTEIMAEAARREEEGTGSPAADVARSGGASRRRAKQLTERAKLTKDLPKLSADVDGEGPTNTENLDHLARRTANLSSSERKALAALESDVASAAAYRTPEQFEKYVTKLLARIKDRVEGDSIAERQRNQSSFGMERQFSGMWSMEGQIDLERGTEVEDVINARAKEMVGDGPVTANARCAALHDLIVNGRPGDGTNPSTRMGIGYIVDTQTLFEEPHDQSVTQTWGGDDVEPERISYLACDAEWIGVVINKIGKPSKVGRSRRKASREQRLRLRSLYTGCPLDGTPFNRCEIHHVNKFWDDQGETEIENLLPISMAWHHRIHDKGWSLKMAADRSLKLWRPDGTLEREIPPPTPITRE